MGKGNTTAAKKADKQDFPAEKEMAKKLCTKETPKRMKQNDAK